MASIIFYLDKENNGNSLILLSFTFNHKRLRLSTGLTVPKISWDQESQKAKPIKDFIDENKRLRETVNFFLDKYDELFPKGIKPMPDEVQRKSDQILEAFKIFSGRKKAIEGEKVSLISFISMFRERYKNKIGIAHLNHYKSLKTHLEGFQTKTGFRIDFDTIGKDFYIKFTDYLGELNLKPNTVGGHIKRIKRLMNEANEDKLTTNQDHKNREFKVIKEDVDTIYLTENEIKLLYEMQIDQNEYRRIRDIFILNCYTGLRHSDWSKVSSEQIRGRKLYVRTQKTNEPVIIPVKPLVLEILKRYGTIDVPPLQKTNDAIRWIGQKAFDKKLGGENIKKWREIRTHTVRRSFATNAYLAGIPMRDVMQITGHRTTESFLKYIRVTKLETAEKLKDHPFFS
ncbi:MAG: phage integrase SAM-like domain-containing protein [Bacteroidetes bacterium]|nr:phage integrase SAM-like domain-containing protein [Bacteroidota bacterium]